MNENDCVETEATEERARRFRNHRLRRGIYLLPSFFTVANLFCGYRAVIATLDRTLAFPDEFLVTLSAATA